MRGSRSRTKTAVHEGPLLANYTFTGQYSYTTDFGLMFYNARMYDPTLGRFTSADTIIPGGVQGLDRYAYVNNSPVMYVAPSGHYACDNVCTSGSPKQSNKTNTDKRLGLDQVKGLLGFEDLSEYLDWYHSSVNNQLYIHCATK